MEIREVHADEETAGRITVMQRAKTRAKNNNTGTSNRFGDFGGRNKGSKLIIIIILAK